MGYYWCAYYSPPMALDINSAISVDATMGGTRVGGGR